MALDVGERRIGVAVSDELGILATPIAVIPRRTRQEDLRRIAALIAEYRPAELVVGLPLLPSGAVGPQARQSVQFAERLRQEFGLPVRLWNESYSTIEAQRRRRDAGRRKQSASIDAEAAAVFLQDYLDHQR